MISQADNKPIIRTAMPNLSEMVGNTVIASVPFLQEDPLLFKLHGTEQSGLWLESQDITEELLKKLGLPAAQNTVVLFVPFAQIRCVFGNVASPALSREAFGLDKP